MYEEELYSDESKEVSYDNQRSDMSATDRSSDRQGRECEDKSSKHEKTRKKKINAHLK